MTSLRAFLTRERILSVFASAVILCSIALSCLNVPMVSAAAKPKILISHSSSVLNVGETFTTTINLTDLPNLSAYQVVVKYNGTVLNLTNVWFPDDFVFVGQNPPPINVWSNDTEAAGDLVDHLNYTVAGSTLFGITGVSVSNGTLCKLNFTVVGVGSTSFSVATLSNPAHAQKWDTKTMTWVPDNWYTYCFDQDYTEYNDFDIIGQSQLPPPLADPTMLYIEIAAVVVAVVIVGVGLFVWRRRRGQVPGGGTTNTSETTNTPVSWRT